MERPRWRIVLLYVRLGLGEPVTARGEYDTGGGVLRPAGPRPPAGRLPAEELFMDIEDIRGE